MPAPLPPPISPRVAKVRRGLQLRANSLLITFYGDALAARGQAIWLGSLIALAEAFGLSSRLVRTSAFRLTADDWFEVERIGRRSYYKLSETGALRVQHADRRIYEFEPPEWDHRWTTAILDSRLRASVKQRVRRELLWEGFGQVAPGVLAHPRADLQAVRDIVDAAGAGSQVAVLSAEAVPLFSDQPLRSIMASTFKLGTIAQAWRQFVTRFAPVAELLPTMSEAEAFFIRTLLIHEYRRVLLRDPHLPEPLLPPDWPGTEAQRLCARLYGELLVPSESYLQQTTEASDGALRRTPREVLRRVS